MSCSYLEAMNTSLNTTNRPWILGALAVYAPTLHAARQAYEMVTSRKRHQAFGTVTLITGEEVDWIDMHYDENAACYANVR